MALCWMTTASCLAEAILRRNRSRTNRRRLQLAYRLDTSLVNPLHGLPAVVASNPAVLATRNLLRAWRLGLPSGQAVAARDG